MLVSTLSSLPWLARLLPDFRNKLVPEVRYHFSIVSATPLPQAAFERLPSGRHKLKREAVVASQRGRLLFAIAQIVAEKGYVATTVADVVERAGVSRRTFYEQFPDKEACFLAAYDTGVEVMLGRIRDTVEQLPEADWRARARASIETYMEVLAAEPGFAWSSHVEVLGAGPAALARRSAILGLFAELWRGLHDRARREDPSIHRLPKPVFRTLVGGHEELVREHLRTRDARSLPELAGPVYDVTLAIIGDGAN
jgi:AcrR family transcriptional regulator